jgi:hydrogenase maturation protein HypF
MAGCIAEHKLNRPVIGVIYDGTGLGDDHRIWGGEILIGDLTGYIRAGHLRYCSIQGGDMAVKEPWRTAVSYLYSIGFNDLSFINDVEGYKKLSVTAALKAGLNCHESSSMGRLFDCVSALLGLCSTITYDAQAAIRLEGIADKSVESCYEFYINEENGCLSIDYSELLRHIIIDIKKGQKASVISGKFHNTIAAATAAVVREVSRIHGTTDVVLSGGCFENLLLLELMLRKLEHQGCKVYFNERLPCNDGGISFGQLAAADRMLKG